MRKIILATAAVTVLLLPAAASADEKTVTVTCPGGMEVALDPVYHDNGSLSTLDEPIVSAAVCVEGDQTVYFLNVTGSPRFDDKESVKRFIEWVRDYGESQKQPQG